ncbi:MAG TPA: DUF5654 family protein [Ktedonobacterales bacterium]
MDEHPMTGQTPVTATEAAAHHEAAAAQQAGKPGAKRSTPNRLVAQVGTQMSALQQAETIKQLQSQVKQLESQSKDAGRVLLATMTTLATSAFGLVAALAWNEAIKALIEEYVPNAGSQVVGTLIYAVIVTLIAVIVIYYLGKLNGRWGKKSIIGDGGHIEG